MQKSKNPRWRIALPLRLAAVLAALVPLAQAAPALARTPVAIAIQRSATDRELAAFYAARNYRPLWVRGGALGREADLLLGLLETAHADGRDPGRYRRLGVREAIEAARRGDADALGLAEVVLSKAFAAYVRDVRRPAEIGVVYGEPSLKARLPNTLTVLGRASAAPSLERYLQDMGWMHPIYANLRQALASSPTAGGILFSGEERLVRLNLERARILPAHEDRYILVDAAAARLFYYEDGKVRESMRVVVGTPDQATPLMVGMIRYAMLNPYWYVPTDISRARIAPRVLKEGLGYFRERGYELMSSWSHSATILDPSKVDWQSVADGRVDVFIRQRPGPSNGMGKVKFQFPNELGIYLHDTPAKQLFNEDQRGFSAGCVRLEDADGLGRLLFGRSPPPASDAPEQTVPLSDPVPVYITYLTAVAEKGQIVERRDIYGRDKARTATLSAETRETALAR